MELLVETAFQLYNLHFFFFFLHSTLPLVVIHDYKERSNLREMAIQFYNFLNWLTNALVVRFHPKFDT